MSTPSLPIDRLNAALAGRLLPLSGRHVLPRMTKMAESLEWLDKYLGPVTRK